MRSATRAVFGAAMLAMAQGQGVVLSAVGDSGTSLGLQVQQGNTADANFISAAEINANVVNECGRTLLAGNIDIGEKTEDALAVGNVTKVAKGSTVKMTIDQVNANGTGPYTCDLDPQGNTLATGQTALTVKEADSAKRAGTTTLTITMPKDLACSGSSAGNVCTIRCKNAQDFGGCVAVQQTDVTPLAGDNPPSNITIAASLAAIEAQVQQDQKDLPAAIAGNQAATSVDQQGVKIAAALLAAEPTVVAAANAEVASAAAAATKSTKNGNNNNANAKANKNGNNANTNAAAGGATKANKGANANANANAAGAAGGATKANKGANANANANAAAAGGATQANKAANKNQGNTARRFQRGRRYVAAGVAFEEANGN